MSNNFTGRPQSILNGTDDNTGRINVDVLQNIAGFNPLIFLITERGPEGTHDLDSVGGISVYGSDSLRANSPFATHQTELAKSVMAFAPVHIHRVRLPGSRRSIFRVSAELATVTLPIYLRDPLGNVKYELDEIGSARPIIDGYTVGSRVILHYGTDVYPINQRDFGKAEIISNFRAGSIEGNVDDTMQERFLSFVKTFSASVPMPSTTPTDFTGMTTDEVMNILNPQATPETADMKFHSTTLFPLFETEMGYFGKVGDKFGFVIDDLIALTNGNVPNMWDVNNFLYQLRLIEVGSVGSNRIIPTKDGDRTTTIALSEIAYSERFNTDYTWVGATTSNYADVGLSHHYSGSVDALTKMLIEGYTLTDGTEVEGELAFSDDGMLSRGAINVLGGVNANNKPYSSLRIQDSIAFGGAAIGGNYPVMGSGGNDGLIYDDEGRPNRLMNLKLYDEEVRRQLDNFGDLEDQLLDIPRFPISALVDTGFGGETKDAMVAAFNKRPDIFSILTTFRVADYTEPEPPAKPTPRKSMFNIVRPPQNYITEQGATVVEPKFLAYLIEKTDDPTIVNVTITIDQNATAEDLFYFDLENESELRKKVPLGFALSNRDYMAILDIEAQALTLGNMKRYANDEMEYDEITFTSDAVQQQFRYPIGSQHAYVNNVHLDHDVNPSFNGKYIAGTTTYRIDLDFDGPDPELGELYLNTISRVNVTVQGMAKFKQDEEYIVLSMSPESLESKRFDINISGKDYKNISASDIVTAVNREGLGTEAKLIKIGWPVRE